MKDFIDFPGKAQALRHLCHRTLKNRYDVGQAAAALWLGVLELPTLETYQVPM
jgi:hypothetical protein